MADAEFLSSTFSLDGSVALVTGASSGIGAHIAMTLAKAGADVVIGARRKDRIESLASDIQSETGRRALAVDMDVTQAASVDNAFDAAASRFGVPTIVCNNAGVARTEWAIETTEEAWDFTMDTNLKGAWRVAKVAAQRMRDAGKPGTILNTASILGLRVAPMQLTYAISKAGVVQMTKAMAIEFHRFGIRVNALCPGYFKTEINDAYLESDAGKAMLQSTPGGRAGRLEELDAAVLAVVGPGGSFISGAAIPVDYAHHLAMG